MEKLIAALDAKAPEKWKILFSEGDGIARCYYPRRVGVGEGGFAVTWLAMVVVTRLRTFVGNEAVEKFEIAVLGNPWGEADIPLIAEAVEQLEDVLEVVYEWATERDPTIVRRPRTSTPRKKRQSKPKAGASAPLL